METLFRSASTEADINARSRAKPFARPSYMLLTGLACISFVLYMDATQFVYYSLRPTSSFWVCFSRHITAEEFPAMSVLYLLKIFLLLTTSALIIRSVLSFSNSTLLSKDYQSTGAIVGLSGAIFTERSQTFVLGIVTTLCLFFVVLFLADPVAFNSLCMEDHAVETYSAVFQFLNCGLFIYIWVLIGHSNIQDKRLYRSVAGAFIIFFFLCGGEEVSWFQRLFNIKTPDVFASNLQFEMNLHNFATHPLENIYYFLSFAFLVFVPFVKERTKLLKGSSLISLFTPDSFVLLISIPFVAYNYTNLNVFATQLSVGLTFFILLDLLRNRYHQRAAFGWTVVMFLLFVVTQMVFLIYGHRMVRTFDEKEYKEMLIPLSYLVFTMGVLRKVKRLK